MIPSYSKAEIDDAVVWAAQNDHWSLLCALRPYSKLNCPTGALKLIRIGIHHGSKGILNNTLRNELTSHLFQQHASLIIKEALQSEYTCGLQWLLKNKSFLGLKSDHFYFTLTGRHNYLTASKNAVDYLTQVVPSDNYDWLHMAQQCAEKGDIHRCMMYLNKTPNTLFEREKSIQKTVKKALRCGNPDDYGFLLEEWQKLRQKALAHIIHIPQLFSVVLEHSNPQKAVQALLVYCGSNFDFCSLGSENAQKIEHYRSMAQKERIGDLLDQMAQTSSAKRKM